MVQPDNSAPVSEEKIISKLDELLKEVENLSDVEKLRQIVKRLSEKISLLTTVSTHKPVFQFLGWDFIMIAIDEMKRFLNSNGDSPDILIGMGRGGAILAGLLAHKMEVTEICALSTRKITGKEREIMSGIKFDLKGKHVLLMDDNLNSGETMKTITDFAKQNGAKDVKCMVICKKISAPKPDFFIFESNQLVWYPWDRAHKICLSDTVF